MYSLILRRKPLELQKWRNLVFPVKLVQNVFSAFPSSFSSASASSFSSASAATDQDGRKGQIFGVSYLVNSLGLTRKLAESISSKVSSLSKGNPDSVLDLLTNHGFTDSQIANIITTYPRLLMLDADISLAPKLQFLQSRGASSEVTMIVSKYPKILGLSSQPEIIKHYNLVREMIEADMSGISRQSLPQVDTNRFNVYKSLGLAERDIWVMFNKWPKLFTYSEQKIMSSTETFLGMGFSKDEFEIMVKRFPRCFAYSAVELKKKTDFLVNKMNWPLKALVSNPQVLGYSMNMRILPRCNVIQALSSKGLLKTDELPKISCVMLPSDRVFLDRYVEKHHGKDLGVELMAIFNTRDTESDPNLVLSLLRSHEFTDSQISLIIKSCPKLLSLDAHKSLAPKLHFLQSRAASSSELTTIVVFCPSILSLKGNQTAGNYYDFSKDIIKAANIKLETFQGLKQQNLFTNSHTLIKRGVPKDRLFTLLRNHKRILYGTTRFEESLKKVVDLGVSFQSPKFTDALKVISSVSEETIEEKVNVYQRLGFAVEDVWVLFKKFPIILSVSKENILNSSATLASLGFSRDEFPNMVKRHPPLIAYSTETVKEKVEFLVMKMNWPFSQLRPEMFSYSMEKRIVPRCNVIQALSSKGLLKTELPPLRSVLYCTNQTFLNRYVNNHDDKLVAELKDIFTRGHTTV